MAIAILLINFVYKFGSGFKSMPEKKSLAMSLSNGTIFSDFDELSSDTKSDWHTF